MTDRTEKSLHANAVSRQKVSMDIDTNIYIAGHRGMVGSALLRNLKAFGYKNLITRTHAELDLVDQHAVDRFFASEKVQVVFLAAAKVGGIHANNTHRADFIYQNLMIQANVIHAAYKAGIQRLLFLGSSCIYPRQCPQPMREEALLSGYLEPTNEPYAVAKIAGIKLCESYNRQYGTQYRAVMPTNLYGPNDNYDLLNSHVLPAMIRKFHLAKLAMDDKPEAIQKDERVYGPIPDDIREALQNNQSIVRLWGSGAARREFLHVDDMADACRMVMQIPDEAYQKACRSEPELQANGIETVPFLNIGSGEDIPIRELAESIGRMVGFKGQIYWNDAMPDGVLRKLMDSTRVHQLGWRPRVDLMEGIRQTYTAYKQYLTA